jgi:hypothetical protein
MRNSVAWLNFKAVNILLTLLTCADSGALGLGCTASMLCDLKRLHMAAKQTVLAAASEASRAPRHQRRWGGACMVIHRDCSLHHAMSEDKATPASKSTMHTTCRILTALSALCKRGLHPLCTNEHNPVLPRCLLPNYNYSSTHSQARLHTHTLIQTRTHSIWSAHVYVHTCNSTLTAANPTALSLSPSDARPCTCIQSSSRHVPDRRVQHSRQAG